MRLIQILGAAGAVPARPGVCAAGVEVGGMSADSRRIRPGDLFFALAGESTDGHAYLQDARQRGAVAAVVQHLVPDCPLEQYVTPDTREALALAAAEFYGHPSRRFPLIGVTGTNGKTTITFLVRQLLGHEGLSCGLLGTVQNIMGPDQIETAELTTPQSNDIQSRLARMLENGCKAAVMEVSSHGLSQKRSHGLDFQVGVFTNLTPDHLDYHPDMEHYFQAKSILFQGLGAQGRAVIGWDDPYGERLAAQMKGPVIRYGEREKSDVRILSWTPLFEGAALELEVFGRRIGATVALMGRFNAQNIAAATGVALALGVPVDSIQAALPRLQPVPGRMERVEAGQDFRVLVDYAHTPDALEKALAATREHTQGRLVSLFGCGGCRYRLKRGAMGQLSVRMADFTVITSDNPRSESPAEIIEQIVAGAVQAGGREGEQFIVEPDRRAAIRKAVARMCSGDALLLAGKGHEDYQILSTGKVHLDDREEARAALLERLGAKG
ncbi:UDP-N-acetylmuramoyl-L-alanyl-D-glutamate--2,6-diaminopimelate ligase [bacterium]|nr:UDP-N-acetylmuramoyl-L-alanyl-D-glutamate--2,6-diaminopimelate ligase [bacterium]